MKEGRTRAGEVELPFELTHDATGYLLVVDGEPQMRAPSLLKQVRHVAKARGVELDRSSLEAVVSELRQSMGAERSLAHEALLGQLFEGDAFNFLYDAPAHLRPGNVATVMGLGDQPVAMLLPEWLVLGELHWLYSEPEGGKTWIAMLLAGAVMQRGGRVVWVDEELGLDVFAGRLRVAGLPEQLVRERMMYLEFPSLGSPERAKQDAAMWARLLRTTSVDLVVVDTATDALAEAEVDENKGAEVTRWVKDYAEPARRSGAAVLVLDHVTKPQKDAPRRAKDYAVGSRAKRAKAKVQYRINVDEPFRDVNTTGEITVEVTKNTRGAAIPEERTYRIGGTPFVFERVDEERKVAKEASREASKADSALRLRKEIEDVLHAHAPHRLSTRQVCQLVTGKNATIVDTLKDMATSALWKVDAGAKGRSVEYWYVEDAPDEHENPGTEPSPL